MSNQVTEMQIEDYKSTVAFLLQQRASRFAAAVTMDTYQGSGGRPVNQIGAVTAQKKTSRHSDTPLIETPHDARWVYPEDYEWADLVDNQDKRGAGLKYLYIHHRPLASFDISLTC